MGGEVTTRILPPEEWVRLAGTELEAVWPHLDTERARVIVVEDDAGTIVGCWALFPLVHAEGVWIAPAHRGKAAVARQLYRGMVQTARRMEAQTVLTAAVDDHVAELLAHLKAQQLPGQHFVLTVGRA